MFEGSMFDTPTILRHPETPRNDDAALALESRSHVANNPALQLVAELILKLRTSRLSWWTPELLRDTWDATERMVWFRQRPDIRQRVTHSLTGLAPKAARNKQPDFQAALIDSVIDDGDITVEQFESAFDPIELAAYAPAAAIWRRFRDWMPWDEDTAPNQQLVGWLIGQLIAESSTIEGMARKPILTAHTLRTMIPGRVWHSKIPLEIRLAIDELRFQREQEKPAEPFHAVDDLSVATPTIIAANIPLRDLLCVLDAAEKAMGLPSSRASVAAPPPKVEEAPAAEPPRDSAKVQFVVPVADKVPEKPVWNAVEISAENGADKTADKWGPKSAIERIAAKVLERAAGKEGER